nr:GNAT family N-acetyltransferase [Pseudoalteromonas sp. A22]
MFLHDLVVSQAVSGQGIGALMIRRLVELATQMGYCRIRLVAVQNSVGFWLKLGPVDLCCLIFVLLSVFWSRRSTCRLVI